jgi:prepilin-type N-terminal cleavage/methylation domain-containing protein
MMKQPREQAFTLIELMTVVVIISILASIALPNFLNAQIRAKTARALSEQEVLVWAIESYALDTDVYPLNREPGVCGVGDLDVLTSPVPYLSQLPEDIFLHPKDTFRHEYVATERNGISTYLYVNFLQASGDRQRLEPYGKKGTANHLVYGMGPAFSPLPNPMKPEEWNAYTPSNGTVSTGVIFSVGP